MSARSEYLLDLENFHNYSLIYTSSNIYNVKYNQVLPRPPPMVIPDAHKAIPKNLNLTKPHAQFTPKLYHMTLSTPLKFLNYDLDLYKLILNVRKFSNAFKSHHGNSSDHRLNSTQNSQNSTANSPSHNLHDIKLSNWRRIINALIPKNTQNSEGPGPGGTNSANATFNITNTTINTTFNATQNSTFNSALDSTLDTSRFNSSQLSQSNITLNTTANTTANTTLNTTYNSSQSKISVPPSALNKLRDIYNLYILPYEEALIKAKFEIFKSNHANIKDNVTNINLHPRLQNPFSNSLSANSTRSQSKYQLYDSDSNSRNNTNSRDIDRSRSKYTGYQLDDEADIFELDKDELEDERNDYQTPNRKDEDGEFKWRPQNTSSRRSNRPARWNMSDLSRGAEDDSESGSSRPKFTYNTKIDRSKLKPYIRKIPSAVGQNKGPSVSFAGRLNAGPNSVNLTNLLNSLNSNLPNERDFSLNVLALMTSCPANAPMTQLYTSSQLNLSKVGPEGSDLINTLLRHCGINTHKKASLSSSENLSDAQNLNTFWSKLIENSDNFEDLQEFFDFSVDQTLEQELETTEEQRRSGSTEISKQKTEPILSKLKFEEITLKISLILDISRNLSFDIENCLYFWENLNFRKLIYLCIQIEEINYHKIFLTTASCQTKEHHQEVKVPATTRSKMNFNVMALDILENVSRVIEMEKLNLWEQSLMMRLVFSYPDRNSCIQIFERNNREIYLKIMLTLSNMSTMGLNNRIIIERSITKKFINQVLFQISTPDVEVIVHSLEVFYNLTNISDRIIKLILSKNHNALQTARSSSDSYSDDEASQEAEFLETRKNLKKSGNLNLAKQKSVSATAATTGSTNLVSTKPNRNLTVSPLPDSSSSKTNAHSSSINKINVIDVLISLLSNNIRGHPQHVLSAVILRQPSKKPSQDSKPPLKRVPNIAVMKQGRDAFSDYTLGIPECKFYMPEVKKLRLEQTVPVAQKTENQPVPAQKSPEKSKNSTQVSVKIEPNSSQPNPPSQVNSTNSTQQNKSDTAKPLPNGHLSSKPFHPLVNGNAAVGNPRTTHNGHQLTNTTHNSHNNNDNDTKTEKSQSHHEPQAAAATTAAHNLDQNNKENWSLDEAHIKVLKMKAEEFKKAYAAGYAVKEIDEDEDSRNSIQSSDSAILPRVLRPDSVANSTYSGQTDRTDPDSSPNGPHHSNASRLENLKITENGHHPTPVNGQLVNGHVNLKTNHKISGNSSSGQQHHPQQQINANQNQASNQSKTQTHPNRTKSNSGDESVVSSNISSTLTIDKGNSDHEDTLLDEEIQKKEEAEANDKIAKATASATVPVEVAVITTIKLEKPVQSSENEKLVPENIASNDTRRSSEESEELTRPERLSTPPQFFEEKPLEAKNGRHVLQNQNQKLNLTDFTDCVDREDPISKHIHLTSCLILMNIVNCCVISNDRKTIKKILSKREILARIAFSNMDCAGHVAKILFELDKAKDKV